MHLVGSFYTDISGYTVNETLNLYLVIFMFAQCISDKHFITQLMHKYRVRRYNFNYIYVLYICALVG